MPNNKINICIYIFENVNFQQKFLYTMNEYICIAECSNEACILTLRFYYIFVIFAVDQSVQTHY